MRSVVLRLVLIAFVLGSGGCASLERAQGVARDLFRPAAVASAKPGPKAREGQTTLEELDQLTTGYADRYVAYVVSATEAIERGNPSAEQRRRAHEIRLVQVSAIYDIATNPDPFTRLLDMTLVVTLQGRQWIEEDRAEKLFGERGRPLIVAARQAREDIWKIAAKVMKPDQLEVIDYLIWEWRHRNRAVDTLSFVRFDDFAAARGRTVMSEVRGGEGLLAPVGEATKAVDEVRLLAERAFFYAKRLPFLIKWQVRSGIDDVLGDSQAKELADGLGGATRALERLPRDIAAEREAIFAEIRRTQPVFSAMTGDARGLAGDAAGMAVAFTGFTDSAQRLVTTMDGLLKSRSADGHPFDIREYAAALERLTLALKEANQLAVTTAGMVSAVRPADVEAFAKGGTAHAGTFLERVLDAAFWRGVALIAVFFAGLLAYRVLASRAERGRSGP